MTCKEEGGCLREQDVILQGLPCGWVLDGLQESSEAAGHRRPRVHVLDNGGHHALHSHSCQPGQ